jgi:hypothetical protein
MSDIKTVYVQLVLPCKRYPSGKVEPGFYSVEGDVIHLVSETGKPRFNPRTKKALTRKLENGESPEVGAYRLTKENLPARKSDFNRPIHYPRRGKI